MGHVAVKSLPKHVAANQYIGGYPEEHEESVLHNEQWIDVADNGLQHWCSVVRRSIEIVATHGQGRHGSQPVLCQSIHIPVSTVRMLVTISC